ncbi:helicase HerA domain-containing protein [Dictyobacter formicarum]|uniref:Helicase HerA central domain-containing protein n=1 Tax=Dictyobacter formicarum TaxID=2778368 RepID=A0ABQ3VQQ8_9CHLR|nr:DUF87 domain-containing protein [Dictyobacter formicarum]GHO88153.1 hypothetical protein KSZ_61590 [Dictyobacter formicarum]
MTFLSSVPSASSPQKQTTLLSAHHGPGVLHMIPSTAQSRDGDGEIVKLVTAMQSLVIDRQHPLALEIVGTMRERRLLIRAGDPQALAHAETQLRARFPYASFIRCTPLDDPLQLNACETLSVVDLQSGRASYLPLQIFEKAQGAEDPLLGVLGALDALPPGMRAIAQLALIPAAPTWSERYQRKAVEHALDPERQQERWKMASARAGAGAPSGPLLLLGVLILGGCMALKYNPSWVPSWLPGVCTALLHGQWQQIWVGPHRGALLFLLTLALGLGIGAVVLCRIVGQLGQPPLYDMRQVAERTSRSAYRASLCLYVIGPRVRFPSRVSILGAQRKWPGWKAWGSRMRLAGWLGWTWLRGCYGLMRGGQRKKALIVCWLVGTTVTIRGWCQLRATLLLAGSLVRVECARFWDYWCAQRQARRQRKDILARLIAAYRQYHLADGNFFVPRSLGGRQRRALEHGAWQRRVLRSRHIIDVAAVAALWHMPSAEALPGLAQFAYAQQRTRLLPPALQRAQHDSPRAPLGNSTHAGHSLPFRLPADCLRSHFLIAGKSGEGKSTLITHMAWDAMRGGGGLVLIDPHGDLAEDVLRLVPPERCDDVVLIDLSDAQFACGINPLDATMARGRDKIIADLIKILSQFWAATWGSRMEIAFEYAMRTLYEANKVLLRQGRAAYQYTLLDVIPVLTDESFCHALLETIHDPYILRWWATYFDPLSLQMQRDRVDPVLSKVAKFEGTIARHILGQSQTTIDFSTYIAQEKILLVKLAKGMVGEDVAHILGATLLGFLHVAFEEQGSQGAQQRKQLPIFIDEFQTLDGVDWGALAELRKYGATFCLATQSLDYLQQKNVLSVVLANVKQMAIFRLSAEDARLLHRDLDVEPEDILHLHSLDCYLKLTYLQRQYPAFSLTLCFPPSGDAAQAQVIREQVRRRYMRPISSIDAELFDHLARQIGAVPASPGEKPGAELPQEPNDTTKKGLARQDGGNRGRKSHQQKARTSTPKTAPGEPHRDLTKMNWTETMGSMKESGEEKECGEDTSSDDDKEAEKGTQDDE